MATLKERRESELGEVPPPLTDKDLLELYYKLILTRSLDERCWMLNRAGRGAFFVASCQGHEAAQVGSAYALRPGHDWVLPYYRDLGVVLTLGVTPRDIMLAVLAKAADPASGGRQMPGHFSYIELKVISGSSPLATQIPHGVGVALASKLRRDGAVTMVYFGDGAASKGDFHEGLNFAGVHRLPTVFFCENNGYAISTPQRKQMAIPDIADRAAAYGFPGMAVDGNDILAVYQATREAVERARVGEGPTLIEAKTYRFLPHSSDDDDRVYRTREEVEEWRKKDPLPRFETYLEGLGVLTPDLEREMREKVAREVDDATTFAEQSPYPSPESLTAHLYAP